MNNWNARIKRTEFAKNILECGYKCNYWRVQDSSACNSYRQVLFNSNLSAMTFDLFFKKFIKKLLFTNDSEMFDNTFENMNKSYL